MLGASPTRVFFEVTLPLIRPGVFAGGVFAFIVSFDQFPVSLFLVVPKGETLPVVLFNYMKFDLDGAIAAASMVSILLALSVVLVLERLIGLKAYVKLVKSGETEGVIMISRRTVLGTGAVAAATLAAPSILHAQTKTLKITTWGGKWGEIMKATVLPAFEKEFKCTVRADQAFPYCPEAAGQPEERSALRRAAHQFQRAMELRSPKAW